MSGNIHKAQESIYFGSATVRHPGLEIGVCRGDLSALHFEGKHFTCGSEYLHFVAKSAAKNFQLWNSVISEDLCHLAHRDGSYNTVCLVHTIDHVDDVDRALGELSRVLKKGGDLYFSGISEFLFRPNLLHFILRAFSHGLANRFARTVAERRHHYNLLSDEAWRSRLQAHGLRLLEYKYFEGSPLPWTRNLLHHFLFTGRCFDFWRIQLDTQFPNYEEALPFLLRVQWLPCLLQRTRRKGGMGNGFFRPRGA